MRPDRPPKIYICHLGDEARKQAFILARDLRAEGMNVEMFYEDRSLKSQMKQADKTNAAAAIIIGENEIKEGMLQVRNLEKSAQEKVSRDDLIGHLRKILF